MTKVLFEITDENLETGLRGYPIGYCNTSRVDPVEGLFYMEKPIRDLAYLQPEKVLYLLLQKKFDDGAAFEQFKRELQSRASLHPSVRKSICQLPREAHPMKMFIAAIMILSAFESENKYPEDCLNIIAKLPELVAVVINHHANWGETPKSNPSLGYMENFASMVLAPDVKDREGFLELLKIFNIMHYDHGGGNLSTFVGKAVASGLEDMYGSIAAAMCALAGPRHGKANQDCLNFVKEVLSQLGEDATGDEVEDLIRKRLKNKELVYGFGHAVLRVEDPRATVFYEVAKKRYPDHPLVKVGLHLRERGPKVLKENPKIQNPYPNVDAVSGVLLCAAGFDNPEYFTVLFGLSRAVGIARQIVYERLEARDGKGTPIVRPKYIYKP